jgi:hypothetical protein
MTQQKLSFANITNTDNLAANEMEKTSPENTDQQGFLGTESDPELATENNTLEEAQEMGLYPSADEEHPAPLGEVNNIIPD